MTPGIRVGGPFRAFCAAGRWVAFGRDFAAADGRTMLSEAHCRSVRCLSQERQAAFEWRRRSGAAYSGIAGYCCPRQSWWRVLPGHLIQELRISKIA